MRIACNKNIWIKTQKVLFLLIDIFVAPAFYFYSSFQKNNDTKFSKLTVQSALLLFFTFIMAITSGCLGNPKPDNNECSKSTFIIDEITEGTLSFSDESALPEKFTLKLKACIRSYEKIETKLPHTYWAVSRSRKALETVKDFRDEEAAKTSTILGTNENTVIKTNTDGTGCLSWEEVYDYAHNNQSEWIILKRHVKGISSQRPGTCTIPLAVNPWLQLEKYKNIQVADYREKYERNNNIIKNRIVRAVDGLTYLKQKKEEERKNKVDIIINPLQLNTDNNIPTKGTQRVYQNTIIAKLIYKVKDIHGGLQSNPVPRGDFVIEPILLINERTAEEKTEEERKEDEEGNGFKVTEKFITINTNDRVPVQTQFSDEKMTSDTFQWVTPYERHHSQIKLYLKVIPIGDTAERINPFEGIYRVGDNLGKLLSNSILTLPLNDILRIRYDNKILGKSADIFSEDANPDWVELNYCLKTLLENPSTNENPIATCLYLDEQLTAFSDGAVRAGWNVGDLNIRFFNMQKENWLFREINSLIKTHISDVSHGPIRNKQIHIEILDLTTGVKREIKKDTEDNGNISFNITTQQQWYKRQRYFLKRIRFYTATGELRSEKMIAINPWDYGFTHGYEVNQAEKIRTTCLDNTDTESVKLILKTGQAVGQTQIDTMHKMFCHNPNETQYLESNPDPKMTFLSLKKVFHLFYKTLNSLFDVALNTMDDPQKIFYEKFTSIDKVKIPESYVHLFRSINVYPTPLIDSSLTREVYYNIRFKITPRVVRHDDVPRGQQNKGPLRDGVYIFQMAVLKNDQGRVNGRGAMVKSLTQFHPNAYRDTTLAGTRSLFSCPIEKPDCVELEDFIIPPQNIPIIVRDGMVKVDIPIHVRSEYLLFADSKNIMVFRILPADPKSIECKTGESPYCTLSVEGHKHIYISDFDWPKTLQNIKPAKEHDYDMFFHTYKTPFILAAWGNWNITHELSDSFVDITKQHKYLQVHEIFNDLLAGWNERLSYSEIEYKATQADPNQTRQLEDHTFYLIELYKELGKYEGLKQENEENSTTAMNTINTTAGQIIETLNSSRTQIEQNDKLTEEQKNLAFERIDKMLKEAKDAHSLISSIVSPEATEVGEGDRIEHVDPDTIPVNQPQNTFANEACVNNINYQAIDIDTNTDVLTQSDLNGENCLTNSNQRNEEDLSDKHISYFAAQNTLCSISINLDQQWSRSCGYFLSAEQAQNSFLKTLNEQIDMINETKEQLNHQVTEACVDQRKIYDGYNITNPITIETECGPKEHLIKEAYTRSIYNSNYFYSKIAQMPNLPPLNAAALERIIQSDLDKDNMINDLEAGSFLHALCGFWFSKFYSKEYITPQLLLDGFRQTVKSTLYYQLKGIDSDFLEDTSLPKDPETRKVVEEIRTGIVKMKAHYNEELKSQRLSGEIDELHKWVNNPEDYGFDSQFYKDLESKFTVISKADPLTHHIPSWEKKLSPGEWIEQQFSDTGENTDTNNNFYLSHYLREAIEVIRQQQLSNWMGRVQTDETDFHPVRKCLMNPTHFFGLEKKTIVGELGDILEYGYKSGEGGVVTKLNISEDFLMNTQRDQGGNQQFEAGISMGFELLALPLLAIPIIGGAGGIIAGASGLFGNFFRFFASSKTLNAAKNISTPAALSILAFKGLTPSTNYSYRGYEGTGKKKTIKYESQRRRRAYFRTHSYNYWFKKELRMFGYQTSL